MKHVLVSVMALTALSVAGCGLRGPRKAPAAAAGVGGVRVGMPARRVRQVAGRPLDTEARPTSGSTVWYYEDGVVILREDTVSFCYLIPAS